MTEAAARVKQSFQPFWHRHPARAVWAGALLFLLVGLSLQFWRLSVLHASYDQGVLLQTMWNGLSGHPFQSTLSSQLSSEVVHDGLLPRLGYHRLGQHFTPTLVLWMPLVGLLGRWALPLVQVGLITAAGLTLYRLSRSLLPPGLSAAISLSFFGANAVIGPTWGNFTDLCQLPLCFFVLMLGLLERRWSLWLPAAFLMPLIREDTGVVLAGIALWLLLRGGQRRSLALGLMAWGITWIVVCTNVLMPLFSDDNSRRFMIENFGHYLGERREASSLEVLGQVLSSPLRVVVELFHPPGKTLLYLLGQSLPLAFVPLVALDAWLLAGLPLVGLLLAQGSNDPLSINIRYTLLVAPGLFSGAVLWWSRHQGLFAQRRWRRLWTGAVLLSLLFTLTSNPNRSLSFLIPDSVDPWVYSPPAQRWQHSRRVLQQLRRIPSDASVSATTFLVPHLAERPVAVRFPQSVAWRDRLNHAHPVDWIAADLHWTLDYQKAFKGERGNLERMVDQLNPLPEGYGVVLVDDDLVLLQRGAPSSAEAQAKLSRLLQRARAALASSPS